MRVATALTATLAGGAVRLLGTVRSTTGITIARALAANRTGMTAELAGDVRIGDREITPPGNLVPFVLGQVSIAHVQLHLVV
nr:hypothetical protein [Xanthomonas cucurbitae]